MSHAKFELGMFSIAGSPAFPGVVIDGKAVAIRALAPLLQTAGAVSLAEESSVNGILQHWAENFAALSHAVEAIRAGLAADIARRLVPVEQLHIEAPVSPRQIFCSGANYRKHVIDLIIDQLGPETEKMSPEERRKHGERIMDERAARGIPFVFTKPPSAITGPFDPIIVPTESLQPDWELELGVMIGKPTRGVSRAHALDHVAGYVIANDITNRALVYRPDVPQMGMDWLRCKGSPTYLPIGPWLVPAAFVPNPQDLRITLKLNGEIKQNESTADMIFDVARLIEFISEHVQLLPGDLICTGSPAGNGTHYKRFLHEGDVLEGTIAGLGTQRNPCLAEQ